MDKKALDPLLAQPEFMAWVHRLPHLRWDRLESHLELTHGDDGLDEAYRIAVGRWLDLLAIALGKPHCRAQSRNLEVELLSAMTPRHQRVLCDVAQRSVAFLRTQLGELEGSPQVFVLVAPNTRDHYYSYVSHYGPDGAHIESAGMFIGDPLPQIVLKPDAELWSVETTTAHELSHCFVSHLHLPLWLDEGLACVVESAVTEQSTYLDQEQVDRIQAYFHAAGSEGFWLGYAFNDLEGSEHAYAAARIIVSRILMNHRAAFADFAREANLDNTGQWAANRNLGVSLNRLASGLLAGPA